MWWTSTPQQPHLLLRVTAGHLLLELLLQLLAGADGLLVAGEVGQLLQPGVGEVLRKMLAAPFVGRKEFLCGRDIFSLDGISITKADAANTEWLVQDQQAFKLNLKLDDFNRHLKIKTFNLPWACCPCRLCGDCQQQSWCPSRWSMTWTAWRRRLQIPLNRNETKMGLNTKSPMPTA